MYDETHEQVVKCIVPVFSAVSQISNSEPFPEVLLSFLCVTSVTYSVCVLAQSHGGLTLALAGPRNGRYSQGQNECVGAGRKE